MNNVLRTMYKVSNVLRVCAGGTVHDTNEHLRHGNDTVPPQTLGKWRMAVLLRNQQLDAHIRSHCLKAHRPSQITIAILIIKSILMIKEDKTIYKRLPYLLKQCHSALVVSMAFQSTR